MIASLLLDYPDDAWFARLPLLQERAAALPTPIAEALTGSSRLRQPRARPSGSDGTWSRSTSSANAVST